MSLQCDHEYGLLLVTLWTALKRIYFIAVIDGVFCLDAHVIRIYKRETQSVVTLECGKIMATYNTPDSVVRDKRFK